MIRLLLVGFASIFVSLQLVNALRPSEVLKVATSPSYEISNGNCANALARDMVFQDHHKKLAIPLTVRTATSAWNGNARIYCLQVLSKKDPSVGSTVEVTAGGVNYTYVTVEMTSKRGEGFEYNVFAYGK